MPSTSRPFNRFRWRAATCPICSAFSLACFISANKTPQNNDSRSGAVAGARSDQGNITLDGIDNNSVFGYAFTGVLAPPSTRLKSSR